MKLFGIDLDRLERREPTRALLAVLEAGSGQVVTLNPEMALAARHDERLRKAINGSALILADGVGLAMFIDAVRLTGADALTKLMAEAAARGWRVCFVGGAAGDAEGAAAAIRKLYPSIQIQVEEAGDVRETSDGWDQDPMLLERIRQYRPEILAVAFGHGKQEAWIAEHLKELPSVRVAMGVGGTYAYLSGRIPRAPKWMQYVGLEWLWRVIREPSRIGRIFRAVAVFPISAIWDSISGS